MSKTVKDDINHNHKGEDLRRKRGLVSFNEYREHKREKRIENALRSNNVNELYDIEYD